MINRSPAYREKQKKYDAERAKKGDRRAQVRAIQKRSRMNGAGAAGWNKARKPRTKKDASERIIGVDGEGQDVFKCSRCNARTTSASGDCPQGGLHSIPMICAFCEGVDPVGPCPRSRGDEGEHDLRPFADDHIYTYLAAVDELGELVSEAYNPIGLSHEECAEMILRIPLGSLRFGFMFSYDTTKILQELPPEKRFCLVRPQAREAVFCAKKDCGERLTRRATFCDRCGSLKMRKVTEPLEFNGRSYDFFNGSLTITGPYQDRIRTSKIWDCFRFFGCAFVEALKDWSSCKIKGCGGDTGAGLHRQMANGGYECMKCSNVLGDGEEPPVATLEQIERIDGMKQKRGSFDVEDPEAVKAYCREECHLLARMMRRMIDAHNRAEIPLESYHGAGSTATALLKRFEVADFKGPRHAELEPGLRNAIECAFFGGRFEDSVIGEVNLPCHGYDISSAYPFGLTFLPCLTCGFWRRELRMTKDKLEAIYKENGLAVCRFAVREVSDAERKELAWCPLPFRSEKGSITYGTNFKGWAWAPELLAAIRGWEDLVALDGEAWVYERRCDHQPFGFLPKVYLQRLAWGKEGAGKVLKLGSNATYGKTAQSIGDDPPFQSWIWAGTITSTTRGQLLDAIASAKDRWNVLAVATDGVFVANEKLPIGPPPKDTASLNGAISTMTLLNGQPNGKPLGGWEYKDVPEGIFLAKPGLYYSMKMKFVRARGIGRRELKESSRLIQEGFRAWDRRDMRFAVPLTSRRFFGAKHSIYMQSSCAVCKKSWPGVRESGCKTPACKGRVLDSSKTSLLQAQGRNAYGTWALRRIEVAFDPWPKRERGGLSRKGSFCRLHIRDLEGLSSEPYDVGTRKTTPEGEKAREAKEFKLEQPDWDG